MAKPNATASAMQTVPGMKNGWSTTYLPKRVEPVSSISTAASRVGYVGRTKSADTAAKLATAVKGLTPTASAAGIIAFAVAACEYRSADAKKSTTASSRPLGEQVTRSDDASMCALIRVEPSSDAHDADGRSCPTEHLRAGNFGGGDLATATIVRWRA